ncbi:MAG: UDP-glucose 4-epimerase GalE [Chlamydiota bacterium]
MSNIKILIAGGAGYIGSHVNRMLNRLGYKTVVFDNLSRGNSEAVNCGTLVIGDLANSQDLEKLFSQHKIDAVMHFAAYTAVGESVEDPAIYYRNNVVNTLNLLDAMVAHDIKNFIFSSTAAIFGTPQQELVSENHPTIPINPYGTTKLMVEKILSDYDQAYGIKSACLRYFNAAGGDPLGKALNYNLQSTNLIPVILNCLAQHKPLQIFGTDYPTPDGTCIRDYIHIDDLGSAHIIALQQLLRKEKSLHYNLGNGTGFSVREVITATEKVTGQKIDYIEAPRREGDPPILVAGSSKARQELQWKPRYPDLESIIFHQWQAQNHPQGLKN